MTSFVAMVVAFGAPYVLLISLAMKTATAAAAGALNPGMMAIFSVFLGRLVFGDKISSMRYIGLAFTAVGIIGFTQTGGAISLGHFVLIGTGIMWASYAVMVRRNAIPALNATAIVAIGSALLYLPIYMLFLPKQVFTAPLTDVLMQAGFQGVLVGVVAIYAFNRSAELLGPVAGATLPALIPVATLGLGILFLGETVSKQEVVSTAMITIGLALILVGQHALHWVSNYISRHFG